MSAIKGSLWAALEDYKASLAEKQDTTVTIPQPGKPLRRAPEFVLPPTDWDIFRFDREHYN